MTTATKELVITCANGIKGVLDINRTDTLADVRILIHEELDDDLIVEEGNFAFHVNDIRISLKQEKKKLAWKLVEDDRVVSLQPKRNKRPRAHSKLQSEENFRLNSNEERNDNDNENENETPRQKKFKINCDDNLRPVLASPCLGSVTRNISTNVTPSPLMSLSKRNLDLATPAATAVTVNSTGTGTGTGTAVLSQSGSNTNTTSNSSGRGITPPLHVESSMLLPADELHLISQMYINEKSSSLSSSRQQPQQQPQRQQQQQVQLKRRLEQSKQPASTQEQKECNTIDGDPEMQAQSLLKSGNGNNVKTVTRSISRPRECDTNEDWRKQHELSMKSANERSPINSPILTKRLDGDFGSVEKELKNSITSTFTVNSATAAPPLPRSNEGKDTLKETSNTFTVANNGMDHNGNGNQCQNQVKSSCSEEEPNNSHVIPSSVDEKREMESTSEKNEIDQNKNQNLIENQTNSTRKCDGLGSNKLTTLGTLILNEPLVPMDDPLPTNLTTDSIAAADNVKNVMEDSAGASSRSFYAANEDEDEEEYVVNITPHPVFGLGVGLKEERKEGGMVAVAKYYVKHPQTGGQLPAEMTGKIALGDQLISINDMSLVCKTFEEIISIVRFNCAKRQSLCMKFRKVERNLPKLHGHESDVNVDEGMEVVKRNVKTDMEAEPNKSREGLGLVGVDAILENEKSEIDVLVTSNNSNLKKGNVSNDTAMPRSTEEEVRPSDEYIEFEESEDNKEDEDGSQGSNETVDLTDNHPYDAGMEESAESVPVVAAMTEKSKPVHKTEDERAVKTSREAMTSIRSLLAENPLFCSKDRRTEWMREITDALSNTAPKTTVGVLGNTGVGKSSLLNALLDEASVLPTSGSRGCTAAVVELRYNDNLGKTSDNENEVTVYRGEVEFITREEWATELKILVDECSTQEKRIYAREPDPSGNSTAADAWAKIDQVYGKGAMKKYLGQPSNTVFNRLAFDMRIMRLLSPRAGSGHAYNVIPVQEGSIVPGSANAKVLVSDFQVMNVRMRRFKKKWATAFRAKINSYVYRKGNGNEPQTWPLIRKVVLYGPWSCLSTGACLVDLPGVRDANAARARVAEKYLQNCNQIWVVAPIKRAVDDGTAKELLGEQFKRRLLMDGQYGNVSFICTQTDDCEATEIIRDHADVAQRVPGRWEKISHLSNEISRLELEISRLGQAEDEFSEDWNDADQQAKDKDEELQELTEENAMNEMELISFQNQLDAARVVANDCLEKLSTWKKQNRPKVDQMQAECAIEQRKLKTLCAIVRNEYSTKCLQADFRAGLKDLYRKGDGDGDDVNDQDQSETALPPDFDMDVYCISSNDYLKIQGIKPKSDGAPNTFSESNDTQIPSLRTFVHDTTARHRLTFAKSFVNHTSDVLDRVKLVAINASNVPSGRSSLRCMKLFEKEVGAISVKMKSLTESFSQKVNEKVKSTLTPSLTTGAKKGIKAALPIVESWGSKSRRSKHHRSIECNGLYYSTYQATVRRDGVYTSASAGSIDMNREICDPMEKEFSVDWQRTLDTALRFHLSEAETKVNAICTSVNDAISTALEEEGMDKNRLTNMSTTANRSCLNAVKAAFAVMRRLGTDTQRNLNRSLLPLVKENMNSSYSACLSCPRGSGVFDRMRAAMKLTTEKKVEGMFDKSKMSLLRGIDNLVKQLITLISHTSDTITKHLEEVYSIYWDDQRKSEMIDPVMQEKVRACRDKLLPDFNSLGANLQIAQNLVGIEREGLDLDVMAVDTLDATIKRKIDDAQASGEIINLCDSDEEIENVIAKLPPAKPSALAAEIIRIKEDPGQDDVVIMEHGV